MTPWLRILLPLLALLAAPRAARAQFTPAQLDSLRAATQPPAPAPQRHANSLRLLTYYSMLPNLDSARRYAAHLQATAQEVPLSPYDTQHQQWHILNSLGAAHNSLHAFDSSLVYMQAARALAQRLYQQTPPGTPEALRSQKAFKLSTRNLAGQYGQRGEYARADSMLAILLQQAMDDRDTLAQIQCLLNKAANHGANALQASPPDATPAPQLVQQAMETFDTGIQTAREYLRQHPQDVDAHQPFLYLLLNKGTLMLESGQTPAQIQTAMELLIEALATARANKLPGRSLVAPTLGLVQFLVALQRYDKALAEGQKVLAEATALGLRPQVAQAQELCARAHWGLGQHQAAIEAHQAAIDTYLQTGEPAEAQHELAHALATINALPRHERRALRQAQRDLAAQAAQLRAARSPTP